MDKKKYLENFRNKHTIYSSEINDDLRKLKGIEDVVKKYHEVNRMVYKHKNYESYVIGDYNMGKLWTETGCSTVLHEHSEKIHQLEKIKNELAKIDEVKKDIEKRENWKPIPETNNQENSNKNEETYYCDKCYKEKQDQYFYHKTKNDGNKFCSNECYEEYYGEYCSRCINENKNFKKYLNVIQDGDNDYCLNCYGIVKQEQKEREEQEIRYCKYCSAKLVKEGNLKYSLRICDKNDCFLKLDKELYPDKYSQSNNNSGNYNNKSITIERDREQNQSQQSQLLSQIHQLEFNPTKNQTELNSKKQQLKDLQNKEKALIKSLPLNTQISILDKEIKELSNKSGKSKEEELLLVDKKKELEELLKKQSNITNDKPNRTGLYVGLGMIGILLIFGIFIIARIRKRNKK